MPSTPTPGKPYSAQSLFLAPTPKPLSPSHSRAASGSVRSAARPPPTHTTAPLPYLAAPEKTPHALAHARRRRRARYCALGCGAVVLLVLAVVLPVYFAVVKPRHNGGGSDGAGGPEKPSSCTGCEVGAGGVLVGRDGVTVTTSEGKSFVYRNPFGGYFVQDPKNAFNDGAKAQSWTPALNESWTWGQDKVFGVNLGGWLVPEPFISPAMYQKFLSTGTLTGDEWTLSLAMKAAGDEGLDELREHYRTFITEEDFAQIAGAGLNWVRLPLPYWAVQPPWPGEPFLPRVSWEYALRAFGWARKYGLRVCLDLHTLPGAQNPWVHSGRAGGVNFLQGVMGVANAQRGLDVVRTLAEFVNQDEYKNVIGMFGIVNEPTAEVGALRNFYLHAHALVRNVTGIGAGKGPYVSIHDQFLGPEDWAGFGATADRLALEQHPYLAFGVGNAPDIAPFLARPCSDWAPGLAASQSAFGVTTAGEWSLGFNDCGLYVNGLEDTHQTTDCTGWDQWESWTDERKGQLRTYALAQMDALQNWFFWTWKILPDSQSNAVRAPLWSYQLGLQNGWMPTDPRAGAGTCASLSPENAVPSPAPYSAWQTGGSGATTLAAVWPPSSVPEYAAWNTEAHAWPTYTATAPVPSVTGLRNDARGEVGEERGEERDVAPVSGCEYPDAWRPGTEVPDVCQNAQRRREIGRGDGVGWMPRRTDAP